MLEAAVRGGCGVSHASCGGTAVVWWPGCGWVVELTAQAGRPRRVLVPGEGSPDRIW